MVIQATRLRQLVKVEIATAIQEDEGLIQQIQQHPYVEEIPKLEKEKVAPYLEDQDEIRALNILINQAKCAAIRDKQVLEKKEMQIKNELYQDTMDKEVEIARIENINELDAKKQLEIMKRAENADNIRKQIEENKMKEFNKKLEKAAEAKMQLLQFQGLALEEERKKELNSIKKKEFTKSIIASNKEASDRRRQVKFEELEADKKMLKYTMDKIGKEVAVENKRKELAFLKEKEFALLSISSSKKDLKKNDKDEMIALKAAYEFEMKCRAEESKKLQLSRETREHLIQERIKLKQIKATTVLDEIQKSQKEYDNIVQQQRLIDDKMRAGLNIKKLQLDQYLVDIKSQIDLKKKAKKDNFDKLQAELTHFNDEIYNKQAIIDQLKHKKVDDLQRLGVPEKYLYDVKKFIAH